MPLTRIGRNLICSMLIGQATKDYNSTGAVMVVGNGNGAHSATSTYMTGASKALQVMDATYPQVAALSATSTDGTLTFRSTFASSEANFAWEEWGIYNSTSCADGSLLNRAVATIGTKTCAQSWQMTGTVTVTT